MKLPAGGHAGHDLPAFEGVPDGGRVAVLGAGTMGRGIAQVAAAAGFHVILHDRDPAALARGLDHVEVTLARGVELGKVSAPARDATRARLHAASGLAMALEDVDLVVEAIPEVLEWKSDLFREVEALVSPSALIATNTSSLSISALGEGMASPQRFLGLHFFNPVHIMALVEVVYGSSTHPSAVEAALDVVHRMGKEPIVVKDSPGFASSRLGVLLGLEAIRMVEEGVASAEHIDGAMELGYRHPMGPLRLTDLVGLDVRLGIAEYLHTTLGSEAFRPPELLRRMVEEGHLGKKAGRGFYPWNSEEEGTK
ncbi:MAG: 3-hydroxyacyl-CoA dehydrogenase family protein [Gemmatimonadota bacterium]